MKYRRIPFEGPYFDPTGLGFRRPQALDINRRALTILAVCWHPTDREAIFVNADGYALPLEAHPYDLLNLLHQAERREFGKVLGDGQFAMKPAQVQALEKAGKLKPWVVYHFAPPAGYVNDDGAWAGYVAKEVAHEQHCVNTNRGVSWKQRLSDIAAGSPETEQDTARKREELEHIEAYRKEIEDRRAEWLQEDAQITAWLRGDVGHPPLLALMMGAA